MIHSIKKNDKFNKNKLFLIAIITVTKINETPKIVFSRIKKKII